MKRWMAGMAAMLIAAGSVHAEGARGTLTLSQMADDTPADEYLMQCGYNPARSMSLWRRFRFDEFDILGSAAVGSVTVAMSTTEAVQVTANLYTIPRSLAEGSLPVPALTRTGTATITTPGAPLSLVTVPVSATIPDTQEFDLVAEYHVDQPVGDYRFGANGSDETHEAFVSSPLCGHPDATPMSQSGYSLATHPILIVGIGSTGPGLPRLSTAFGAGSVTVGVPARLTLTLHNETRPAATTLAADLVDRLPSGLVIAAVPNATTTCDAAGVTAAAGTGTVTLAAGARIPASQACTVAVDVRSSSTGRYVNTMAPASLRTDAGTNLNTATATLLVLSDAPPSFPPGENFDVNPAPALPNGWISSVTTGSNDWVTVASDDTMPNAVWVHAPLEPSDYTLDSPVFVPVAHQNVSFRQRYDLDRAGGFDNYGIDGGALEISIDDGEFVDILDAGGSFAAGGYNVILAGEHALTGRRGWSGDTGGVFVDTTVTLPANAAGHPVRLRFHFADNVDSPDFYSPRPTSGWWIDTITLGIANPPVASIGPERLSLTVAADDSATTTFTVANEYGKDPLEYAIRAYDAGTAAAPPVLHTPAPLRPARGATLDAVTIDYDDGVPETAHGYGRASDEPPGERAAVWLNRFHADAAVTVDSISVFWPAAVHAAGDLHGLQANLVAYYDADADGDPSNAVRLGGDRLVSITKTGQFEMYPTAFAVPGAGDVYVGFIDQWAIGGNYRPQLFPAALDTTTPQGHSYVSFPDIGWRLDVEDLGRNLFTGSIEAATGDTLSGNWLIHATTTGESTPEPCAGLKVNWLTALPAGGIVDGGTTRTVTVRATPAIAGLQPGRYTHELCVATNDPRAPLVVVPVDLTVTQAPCATTDSLFCNSFEAAYVQPLRDPSFEQVPYAAGPNPYWTSHDGFNGNGAGSVFHFWQSSEASAHSGYTAAMFGGWGRLGQRTFPYRAYFEQTVTFPRDGVLFLNYWRFTDKPADVPSPFVLTIDEVRVDGADFSAHVNGGFVAHSVDVSAWADGAAHTIRFQYDYRGYYYDGVTSIDDVTLERKPLP